MKVLDSYLTVQLNIVSPNQLWFEFLVNRQQLLTIKILLTDLLTNETKSNQLKWWPKNDKTLQIIDFARFWFKMELPPSDLYDISLENKS